MPILKKPRFTSILLDSARPETIRLALVPMMVMHPPRMAAKLKGIMSLEGGRSHCRHHCCTIGIIMATIGVLFKKALNTVTAGSSLNWALSTVEGVPKKQRMNQRSMCVFSIAFAIGNMIATVITPELQKPAKAPPSSTMFSRYSTPIAMVNTSEGGTHSSIRNTTVKTITTMVTHACQLIAAQVSISSPHNRRARPRRTSVSHAHQASRTMIHISFQDRERLRL
mmetsp:Transcript_17372/g.51914  ORF Transcript_17372/g.51914 Transcript_17372/m.51914 type:complete len:225 (-) Transcript_17372:433-1107(-)